jgi:hypothetical protein
MSYDVGKIEQNTDFEGQQLLQFIGCCIRTMQLRSTHQFLLNVRKKRGTGHTEKFRVRGEMAPLVHFTEHRPTVANRVIRVSGTRLTMKFRVLDLEFCSTRVRSPSGPLVE